MLTELVTPPLSDVDTVKDDRADALGDKVELDVAHKDADGLSL